MDSALEKNCTYYLIRIEQAKRADQIILIKIYSYEEQTVSRVLEKNYALMHFFSAERQ